MATSGPSAAGGGSTAHLGFLAIFNPSLGPTDDTLDDQIVYYASVTTQSSPHKRRRTRGRPTDAISQEERNERLRQIGLAQGMASFSRGFAGGASVDTIETEKSRVVLHELEPGWWILASIDLTKVPLPPRLPTKSGEGQEEKFEYSSRELKPASLILRDLLRAHSIFLMHHDTSLSALFVRSRRSKFVAMLSRYWDLYLSTWNVMLHGNPTRDVFWGINVAASGELGFGVGEEDRGSGEREVLEGLVGRIEGLVDLVVSRFGLPDPDSAAKEATPKDEAQPWLGTGEEPGPEDGAIFLGTGALSKKSLRDVAHWMEDLYTWGEHAYGVIDSPTSVRRNRKDQKASKAADESAESKQIDESTQAASNPETSTEQPPATPSTKDPGKEEAEEGKLDKMVTYLKLGYGSYWSLPGTSGSSATEADQSAADAVDAQHGKSTALESRPKIPRTRSFDAAGHYLIGLKGDIEENQSDAEASAAESGDAEAEHNSRTVLRTVNVELESEAVGRPEATIIRDLGNPASLLTQSQVVGNMLPGYDSHDLNKAKKVRVVVYVNRPFIFTFFFHLRTDSLAWEALYRSLHYQLSPLKKSLLASTSHRPQRPNAGSAASSIEDLVWDPANLTVHSTIPNIPENYDTGDTWSRADALSTHLHLLNIYGATRRRNMELERTEKTSRGWWIVWTRVLDRRDDASGNLSTIHESGSETDLQSRRSDDQDEPQALSKEIFLIRRASDHIRFHSVGGSQGDGGREGPGKLVQGIGVDTRRYIEELLTLL